MESLETLLERSKGENVLTAELEKIYAGPLLFPEPPEDRPWVMVNFVRTLDGYTSFRLPGHSGGGDISGFNQPDQFIMGLLRAVADAVMVGANTLRTESEHLWTSEFIAAPFATQFADLRKKMGKTSTNPYNMFITRGGEVLPGGPENLPAAFRTDGVDPWIMTTESGRLAAMKQFEPVTQKPEILAFGAGQSVDLVSMMKYLRQDLGVRFLLVEGGSEFNGQVVNAGLCDDLFITEAPQIIGSPRQNPRPLIVSGFERTPETAIWCDRTGIKISGNYEYKRCQIK